jgi:hypothetical protein
MIGHNAFLRFFRRLYTSHAFSPAAWRRVLDWVTTSNNNPTPTPSAPSSPLSGTRSIVASAVVAAASVAAAAAASVAEPAVSGSATVVSPH